MVTPLHKTLGFMLATGHAFQKRQSFKTVFHYYFHMLILIVWPLTMGAVWLVETTTTTVWASDKVWL